MTQVLIHAGMPKAGSSSVQRWLKDPEVRAQLDEKNLVVSTFHMEVDGSASLGRYETGTPNSGVFMKAFSRADSSERDALALRFELELERASRELGGILLSSEAYAQIFWMDDYRLLDALERLSRTHRVRVAYYVRPQHTALEAAWRQWGFRHGVEPSAYVRRRSRQLHYVDTLRSVRKRAPSVEFVVRPFRTDLLEGGSIVSDFLVSFLGLDPDRFPQADTWANRGLPLEVVNLLRFAPDGMFWQSAHDNRNLTRLKMAFGEERLPDDPDIAASRILLHAYARNHFEPGNRELIDILGWPVDDFISPIESTEVPGLDELDVLWAPRASEAELALMFWALKRVVTK